MKFVFGAMVGTTLGMLFFAHIGHFILVINQFNLSSYMNPFFSALFLTLALVKAFKMTLKRNFTIKKKTI